MTLVGGIIFLVILAPGLFWLLEVILGLVPRKTGVVTSETLSSVILIPAHNEELVIDATLKSLSKELEANDHVLVIADNCGDNTAGIVRFHNMAVTERFHDTQKGKGFALAHGVAEIALRGLSPDVVVVLDADCELQAGGLARLKQAAKHSPVQGRYLLTAPKGASAKQKVSAFAIYIKNHVRLLGLARMGGSVPITGSGFAAPYKLFESADLASGEIVEDMKLGCDWANANHFTRYEPDVYVTSPLPTADADADTQRQRWEHGHVSIIRRYMPKLMKEAFKQWRLDYFVTALDMAVPPLISMVGAYGLMMLLFAIFSIKLSLILFMLLSLISLSLFVINVRAKPSFLKKDDVVGLFKFALSKFGLYRKLMSGEKSGWVKTKRDSSVDADKQ